MAVRKNPAKKAIAVKKSAKKVAVKRPSRVDKVNSHKKDLITALNQSKGIISTACDSVGISRTTFYNYVNEDPEFARLVDESQERAIDFVEGKLFEKINGITVQSHNSKGEPVIYDQAPSDTAIIFYLKTRGKNRGYVEKTVTENTNLNINSDVIVTDEEAIRIKEALQRKY